MAATPAVETQIFESATVVSYGQSFGAGCGVLALGQVLNIRTATGEAVEMVIICPELHDLPLVGQVCDITYETRPPRVLLRWPDGRGSSTADPTPYPVLVQATCPPA